jgi:hypothetical protein
MTLRLLLAHAVCCFSFGSYAQVPHILGNWKLNPAASRLPGAAPQTHIRRYSVGPDGILIGLAVEIAADGTPSFLQFAAKPDGKDYPEFDAGSAARYLMDGSAPLATYAEAPVDSHTVAWTDKYDGRVTFSGRKSVSTDGRTLTITAVVKNERNEDVEIVFVFDRI